MIWVASAFGSIQAKCANGERPQNLTKPIQIKQLKHRTSVYSVKQVHIQCSTGRRKCLVC